MSEPAGQTVAVLPSAGIEREAPGGEGMGGTPRGIPWGATWVLLLSISAVISSIMVMGLHAERGFFVGVLATAVCILAALFDAWTTRIPNPLTYTAILLGLAINGAASAMGHATANALVTMNHLLGAPGISQSLLGFGVCAGLGIFGMMVAKVGGGDIKLLAALGAMLGLSDVASVVVAALAVAVVYAVVNLAVFGKVNAFLRLISYSLLELIYLRRLGLIPEEEHAERPRHDTVPMAVPLAIGLIAAQAFNITARMGMHR